MKRVQYNGATFSEVPCQPASDLGEKSRWKTFEVEQEIKIGTQTNYVLRGIPRTNNATNLGYNAAWFKIVPVYQAIAFRIPKVGENLRNFLRLNDSGNWEEMLNSSRIVEVHPMSESIFEVYTKNSTYLLKVLK